MLPRFFKRQEWNLKTVKSWSDEPEPEGTPCKVLPSAHQTTHEQQTCSVQAYRARWEWAVSLSSFIITNAGVSWIVSKHKTFQGTLQCSMKMELESLFGWKKKSLNVPKWRVIKNSSWKIPFARRYVQIFKRFFQQNKLWISCSVNFFEVDLNMMGSKHPKKFTSLHINGHNSA